MNAVDFREMAGVCRKGARRRGDWGRVMSRDEDFMSFAREQSMEMMVVLRLMGGQTFTESDREMLVDGLDILRVVMVQPVGPADAQRVRGAVSRGEMDRAIMQVVCASMMLWLSGKLDLVEVDPS